MNYISENARKKIQLETYEDYIDEDNEIRVKDKIIDALNIKSLGFKISNNDEGGRPAFRKGNIDALNKVDTTFADLS